MGVHGRLTRRQVLELPEIIYKKPYDSDDDDEDDDNSLLETVVEEEEDDDDDDDAEDSTENDNNEENSTDQDGDICGNNNKSSAKETDINITCNNDATRTSSTSTNVTTAVATSVNIENQPRDGEPRVNCSTTSLFETEPVSISASAASSVSTSEGAAPDEEQPAETSSPTLSFNAQRMLRSFTATTCTSCSICIDEFEEGEKIRLLPLCGHAFHTDCILPWLKDRQGCCPLCKMAVLDTRRRSTVNNSSSSGSDNDNQNGSRDNYATDG